MSLNYQDFVNAPVGNQDAGPARDVIGGYAAPREPGVSPTVPQDPNRLVPATERRSPGSGTFDPPPSGPIYYEGDEQSILRGLTTEDRVRLQEQMVAIGRLTNPLYGEADGRTLNSFKEILAMANLEGEEWRTTLGRVATDPRLQGQDGDEPQFDPKPYLAPDYATLAQEVKSTFRQRLGREPDQAEMAELVGELQGWNKGAYDAEVQYGQSQFDDDDGIPGVEEPPQELSNVDPVSRFQELFDERYSGELDIVERKAAVPGKRASVQGAVDAISRMNRTSF